MAEDDDTARDRAKGRSATSSNLSLALSLLFGVAQVVIGLGVAWRLLARGLWRTSRYFVLLLIAAWFVCSGIAELIVSGMEVAREIGGAPSAAAFARWHGRVDGALVVATVALLACLCAYPLLRGLAGCCAGSPGARGSRTRTDATEPDGGT